MLELPPVIVGAIVSTERLTTLFKTWLKPRIENENLYKMIVMLASFGFGILTFLTGDAISTEFEFFAADAPYALKALFAGVMLGFGGNAARLLWSLKDALNAFASGYSKSSAREDLPNG